MYSHHQDSKNKLQTTQSPAQDNLIPHIYFKIFSDSVLS